MGCVNVGIDWGHSRSRVVVEDEEGELLQERWVQTQTTVLSELAKELKQLANGRPVRVMIETTAGPVVSTLLGHDIEVYAVNPKKVDRARELVSVAGAKDDKLDAFVLAWMLRTCPETATLRRPPNPLVAGLRAAGRRHLDLTEKRIAVQNQIASLCRESFPKLLALGSLDTQWTAKLLITASTPAKLRAMGRRRLQQWLTKARVRRVSAEALLEAMGQPQDDLLKPSLLRDFHATELQVLATQLDLLNQQRATMQRAIDEFLEAYHHELAAEQGELTDVAIVRSLPGAGRCVTATLLGEGLLPLITADINLARAYSGVAPVAKTTGKKQAQGRALVCMRRACNVHVRRAIHFMSEKGVQNSDALKQLYRQYRKRGHQHGRACRQLGDRQLRRLRAMLRDRTLYADNFDVFSNAATTKLASAS